MDPGLFWSRAQCRFKLESTVDFDFHFGAPIAPGCGVKPHIQQVKKPQDQAQAQDQKTQARKKRHDAGLGTEHITAGAWNGAIPALDQGTVRGLAAVPGNPSSHDHLPAVAKVKTGIARGRAQLFKSGLQRERLTFTHVETDGFKNVRLRLKPRSAILSIQM